MQEQATFNVERLRLGGKNYTWQGGQLRDASGQDVPLRAKSLRMFAVLLAERGRLLSKDRLSQLVWPDTVATDESIARCIADIRKVLSDDGHDIIQTYPKQGYRLNAPSVTDEKPAKFGKIWSGGFLAALVLAVVAVTVGLLAPSQNSPGPDMRSEVSQGTVQPTTVAIVPFTSESADGQFLATGLSDDLEIHLAEMSGIKTLSQAHTTAVAGKTDGPLEIARSLGASHIVLGNLRKSGDQIALSIQLIDGQDGATLWADRYEGLRKGLILFRDSIPKALIDAMSVELNARDISRLSVRDTKSPEALEEVIRARRNMSQFTYEGSLAAEKHLRQAISIDPQYARAYAELASAFAIRMENDWIVLSGADTQKAFFFAERALELDPGLWFAHFAMGRLHSVAPTGDIETALRHLETAMDLNPADDDARVYYAIVLMFSGRLAEARALLESVIATHPNAPFWYYLGLGNTLFHLNEYEAALDTIMICLNQMPNSPYCLRTQMAVQASLGLFADAEWTIEEYSMFGYDTSLDAVMKSAIERDPALLARLRKAYEQAGLK